jgi:apolipoprotein N-acyltransferase
MESLRIKDREKIEAKTTYTLEHLSSNEKVLYSIVFGTLLGLVNSGLLPHQFVFICLVPLLLFVQACLSKTEAFVIGLLFGITYYLVTLRWLLDLHPSPWLGLDNWLQFQVVGQMWILEALHQGLLFAIFTLLIYILPVKSGFLPSIKRPFYPYLLILPLLWLFLMWTVGAAYPFHAAPLTQLAYSQSHTPEIVQIAQIAGVQSIDFIIVLVNCALAQLIMAITNLVPKQFIKSKIFSYNASAIMDLVIVTIVLSGLFIWGRNYYVSAIQNEKSLALAQNKQFAPEASLALLQGNFSQVKKTLDDKDKNQFYTDMSTASGTTLLILPEAQINLFKQAGIALYESLRTIAKKEKKEIIVAGVEPDRSQLISFLHLLSGDKVYALERPFLLPLIPFLPANPLKNLLAAKIDLCLSNKLNEVQESNISSAKNTLFKSVYGNIGVSIGADITRQDLIAKQTSLGASLLVNVSDLSWFHNSILQDYLISAAIMRAVENKRYVVLCTNGGVSAIVNPSGIVTSLAQPNSKGMLTDTVQFLSKKSLFTKMWWLWTPIYKI